MPLKLLPVVLLEDRLALHRVLVRAGRAVDVARVGVPGRRRVRVVVGDLAVPDHHVVREHAAHRLGEAAADAPRPAPRTAPRSWSARPGSRPAPSRRSAARTPPRRPGSSVRARSRSIVLLHCGIFHSKLDRALERRLGQVDLHAVPGGLDVADVDQARPARSTRAARSGRRRCPGRGGRCRRTSAATSPSCTCRPGRASAGLRVGVLVPRVPPVDRVAQRVAASRTSPGRSSRRSTELPSRIRMPRLIVTRSVVTSLPSTTTPGVTNILRPQSVMSL